jgi:hypothetical protein
LSHHPCDRQNSYQSHFIGSIARSDLWGIKWLEAYPTFAMVGFEAKPRSPALATYRQTVETLLATLHRLAADGYDLAADQTNIYQSKKNYFFIRLLAMSPPKPNSVPITIMLGSGTATSDERCLISKTF